MISVTSIRRVAVLAAATAFASATAVAHTTIRDQATEGKTADNALKIGHGCTTATGDKLPVIEQSVVFPTVSPVITASDGSVIAALNQVIVQGGLNGLVAPIQDRSVFEAQQVKYDALGNKIGFSATFGLLATDQLGRVPFQFTSPSFVATSCAKRLLVKVAIADVCVHGALDNPRAGALNLWVPNNGSKYSNAAAAQSIDGLGSPATLTVNRDLTANPLPPACGAGIDVTLTPSAADVDANLPIPGYFRYRAP
jgi:hypothetical protein